MTLVLSDSENNEIVHAVQFNLTDERPCVSVKVWEKELQNFTWERMYLNDQQFDELYRSVFSAFHHVLAQRLPEVTVTWAVRLTNNGLWNNDALNHGPYPDHRDFRFKYVDRHRAVAALKFCKSSYPEAKLIRITRKVKKV